MEDEKEKIGYEIDKKKDENRNLMTIFNTPVRRQMTLTPVMRYQVTKSPGQAPGSSREEVTALICNFESDFRFFIIRLIMNI